MKIFKQLRKNEDGDTAIEYGLIAALIAVGLITALGTIGTNLESTFTTIGDGLDPDAPAS